MQNSLTGHPANQLLAERLREYVNEATAPATRRAYRIDLGHFQAWGGKLPATPQMVADYLVTFAESHSPATLQRRLAAISRAHNTLGQANPVATELVRLTMRGIRRKRGTAQRQAKPLLRDDIAHIIGGLGDSLKDTRDRALLLIGFCGAFRRSELVGLNVEDLEFVSQGVIVHLRRSKTDQQGEGRKVGIPYARVSALCPVQSISRWLSTAGITTGPVFRPVNRHGKMASSRLCDRAVASIIKGRAAEAGMCADDLSGHSLRAGLATSATQAGVSTYKIRQQTGHASDAMLSRYVRDGDLFNDNAASLF